MSQVPTTTPATQARRILTRAEISTHEQGSQEWLRERFGKLTASRMHRVINGTQKGWQTLMALLLKEINQPDQILEEEPMFIDDMEHGKEFEDIAIANVELDLDVEIVRVGYARDPEFPWMGASVDGLILAEDGSVDATVEVKCPTSLANHAYVWTNKKIPDKYIPQVQTQNMVYQAPRSLFVSYHSDMPDPAARIAIVEVAPDKQYQQALLGRARKFNADFEMYKANGGTLPILSPIVPQRF